jgi:lipid A disaccharide synthetase
MKISPYSNIQIDQSSINKYDGCIVVFLHDYFDSPHIYENMIFDDFWEWSLFTIKALISAKVKFYVKPHPNQTKSNIDVITKLKKTFPGISFLDITTSNSTLLKSNIRAAITAYGTVANEFAYFGKPSICCAEHPHIAFDFCYTAKSKSEYINLINKVSDQNFNIDLTTKLKYRKDALEYFSIKNNLHDKELACVSNAFREFWEYCGNDKMNNIEDLSKISNKLSSTKGFKKFIENITKLPGEI